VAQADLDLLAADQNRPAHRHPLLDYQRLRKARRLRCSGACPAQPGASFLRDGAGDGAGQDAAGQDVGDRPV
jgi:hypothetical protein